VTGYVDTTSPICVQVRARFASYEQPAVRRQFLRRHGFYPSQCRISQGSLQDPRKVIMAYVEQAHRAGFTIHVHVIGDAAVRTAIDAIEAARAADGIATQPDTLAHLQFVAPEDIQRLGRDHLYAAFTYSWATWEYEYNMRLFPFLAPGAEERMYPVRSVQQAGGVLVAGSDAPVSDRDPIPFRNMAIAVTRALPGNQALNLRESIDIRDVLDAYTIAGAHSLARDGEIGSLQPGKSADFAVLDRDILELGDHGRAAQIADTRVLETWFQGRIVYANTMK
ncbi:MAG: amidohydrolase family protein, partial [Proteobacteria bacterium]|nr:amidohydrolase family protein [Pseudomonadota bacterium]